MPISDQAQEFSGASIKHETTMKKIVVVLVCALLVAPLIAEARGGHYAGGHGSSHKGGHYKNARTGNHYEKRH